MDNLEHVIIWMNHLWVQYFRYLYDVFIPHITTKAPTNALEDDFLVSFNVGNVWFRLMNFGPTYASRSRSVNDIFRQPTSRLRLSWHSGV